jgi:hypothetical protein
MAISAKHTNFVSSPYVNALPAEDFIKVAMKKQEMYDEGRKQIKQNLDNYSKLRSSIVTENEKNYFDQELNKLVKNIHENAGLDFSNIANVESVINLGKPFENDEYLKTALEKGQEYQRRSQELSKIPKDKRNADNDFVYMYDLNKEIESGGSLGKKIQTNKSYNQYVDVKKKLSDIEKEVQGNISTIYRQGPKGYIEKVEIERKTREEISRRIQNTMTPEEQAQIQIHAQANMYRLGSDVVYQNWVGAQKEEMLMADQVAKRAMREIGELSAIKKPTAQQLEDLQNAQAILGDTQKTINVIKSNINTNPDEFDMEEYLPFFTNRFIGAIAESQVKEVIKTDLKEDKVYLENLRHQQTLGEIRVRGQEERKNKQYEQELDYTTQSGASTNLLSGIGKVITKVDGATNSAKVTNMITQIQNNKNLKDSVKSKMISQLQTLQATYTYAEANKGKGLVASFNRGYGNGYTTSLEDFLTSDPIQLIESGAINSVEIRSKSGGSGKDSKTPQQIQAEAKAKVAGELEAKQDLYKKNPELTKLLYGSSKDGGIDLAAEEEKMRNEADKNKNESNNPDQPK